MADEQFRDGDSVDKRTALWEETIDPAAKIMEEIGELLVKAQSIGISGACVLTWYDPLSNFSGLIHRRCGDRYAVAGAVQEAMVSWDD